MRNRQIDATLHQSLADTMARLYSLAGEGGHVSPTKLHALWTIGADLPRLPTWGVKRTVKPSRTVRGRLATLFVSVFMALDNIRLASAPHAEPTTSRISQWASRESARVRRERLAIDTDGEENEAVLLNDSEAFYASGGTDLVAGQLMGDCHGAMVLDKDRLERIEAQATKAHTMATIENLCDDGMELDNRGRLTHKGISFADVVADEVGPWTYDFDIDGEQIRLGYQGTMSTETTPCCDEPMTDDGQCPGCGKDIRKELEDNTWAAEQERWACIEGGYMSDLRKERAHRFDQEFDRAVNCPAERIVQEYRAAWVRYRMAHLAIGRAVKSAPRGHGLWAHVWLTKDQWKVVEVAYAARARRTKVDQYGRPDIARERMVKADVIKWSSLAYSLL